MNSILATQTKLGTYTLRNRIVMAPLTRMRANKEGLTPTDLMVEYYRQRATAGLIVTEGSQISHQGQGYPQTPGIYTEKQIEGWKKITNAVHQEGGLIFMQLWHVGRLSIPEFQPGNASPVAPSSIAAKGHAYLSDFSRVEYGIPHALTVEEIKNIIEDYRNAAANAKNAGFDGVEIHGANGYLIEEFLRSGSNLRTDGYGGNIENRAKFLLEVLEAILSVWEHDKVGIRLSPLGTSGGIGREPEPFPLYDYVIQQLDAYRLAYLHIIENRESTANPVAGQKNTEVSVEDLSVKHFRSFYKHPIIAAGGFDKEKAEETIDKGYADAIAFGRHYISTPDLTFRLINGIAPNEFDRSTFYGGGSKGYTDYPFYKQEK